MEENRFEKSTSDKLIFYKWDALENINDESSSYQVV